MALIADITITLKPRNLESMCNPFEELQAQIDRLHNLVLVLSKQLEKLSTDDPMNIKQAAQYLNMSVGAIHQRIRKIPHRKQNNKLYFFKSQLRKYIEEGSRLLP